MPAATEPGQPAENTLLSQTIAELQRLAISPREIALDGGFQPRPTNQALAELAPEAGLHRRPGGTATSARSGPTSGIARGRLEFAAREDATAANAPQLILTIRSG